MAFRPPIKCPLCDDVMEPDQRLEDHLVYDHDHREVARYTASDQEAVIPEDHDTKSNQPLS